jgi:hypothetical protein
VWLRNETARVFIWDSAFFLGSGRRPVNLGSQPWLLAIIILTQLFEFARCPLGSISDIEMKRPPTEAAYLANNKTAPSREVIVTEIRSPRAPIFSQIHTETCITVNMPHCTSGPVFNIAHPFKKKRPSALAVLRLNRSPALKFRSLAAIN